MRMCMCRCDWLLIMLFTYHNVVRKDAVGPQVLAVCGLR